MKSLILLAFKVNTAAHIELIFRNREHSAVTIPLPRVGYRVYPKIILDKMQVLDNSVRNT